MIGVGGGDDADIATDLGDAEAVFFEPSAASDILGVAELGGGDEFVAKVGGFGESAIALDDEGGATKGGTGDDSDLFALGTGIEIEGGIGADVSKFDGVTCEGFHG